jgi:thioredoxin 1
MKKTVAHVLFAVFVVFQLVGATPVSSDSSESAKAVPVQGMVTMVDLGAKKCIPCKMMAPILEKLEKQYREKAAIVFIDVWQEPEQAKKFGVRTIPTQIFYDESGKETYRHVGFMSEEKIVATLKQMGVE